MHNFALIIGCVLFASYPADAVPPERIKLEYPADLVAKGFPSPAVHLTVNGKDGWFLIDTGAGVHTLARWFTKSAGIETVEAETHGMDSSGKPVEFHIVRSLKVHFDDGGSMVVPQLAVADFPAMFEDFKIAGLISPQLLAEAPFSTILDLARPEIRFQEFDIATQELGVSELSSVRACSSEKSQFRNLLYGVRTRIGDGVADLTLDSGATVTGVSRTSDAGRRLKDLKPGGVSLGVSGEPDQAYQSKEVAVDFGVGVSKHTVQVLARSGGKCGADGQLGMDDLRGCVLVLGQRAVAAQCSRE